MNLTRTLIGAAALSVTALSAQAMTIELDFNNNDNGMTTAGVGFNGLLFQSFGITSITSTDTPNGLSLYNSNCGTDFPGSPCTGGDSDLASGPTFGTDPQGRVLIAQDAPSNENGNGTEPDDLLGTYEFIFDFDLPVTIPTIFIMDLEASEDVEFDVVYSNGMSMDDVAFSSTPLGNNASGNNSLFQFDADNIGDVSKVSQLTINFIGTSGAVSGLTYTPVPLPGALPLALGGIAVLGGLSRLRRKA
ncbi:MAG: hypothetical protein AAGF94_17435 [Pseudomonadota bacterium]